MKRGGSEDPPRVGLVRHVLPGRYFTRSGIPGFVSNRGSGPPG